MRSFLVVHSITSPYRIHLFRVLADELGARGVAIHVHFMDRSSAHRPRDWEAASAEIPFPHTFWRDIGPTLRGKRWYLNPGLLRTLAREKADYLMVGGPWDSLTGLGASLFARRKVGIGWSEDNTRTPGRIRGAIGAAKRAVLSRYDAVAEPGEEGHRYVRLLFRGDPPVRVVTLPNIVDESRFRPDGSETETAAARRELGVGSERLALWPARLIPNKGVPEFLSHLEPSDLDGWQLVILGQGPLVPRVEEVIEARGLGERVRQVAHVERRRMPACYRAADLFVLPSLKDPNPLSVVEALHTGLPVLLSDRLGNYPEALRSGENGWGFDPSDGASVRRAVESAFGSTPDQRARMGARSRELGAKHWGSEAAIRRFLDAVPVPAGRGPRPVPETRAGRHGA
jgi:glycosyltransferase involved in cell wall biosynthesis